ncbi:MAG TPA: sigma-54 dependent transcriptional regulator [Bryobacteraceae bacterium]|nr:sigma-54 dependent transcriptional regulator [Bryobacteraceae bacterium]
MGPVEPRERAKVLIVDDEAAQRSAVRNMIERWGFSAAEACDGAEALSKLQQCRFDVIVTDLMMPGMDGMELLRRLKEDSALCPAAIVLTAYGNVDTAITTVHEYGAFWFIEKPIRPRAFRILLERAIAQHRLVERSERLERELSSHGHIGDLVGTSAAMQEVFFLIRQAAPTRASVLVTGESGTGKELVARAIHDLSPRRDGPFIAVNCAAIPESLIESELFGHEKGAFTGALTRRAGCFELAGQGTLLLDEIGDMPLSLQAKLLRVLEDRRIRRLGAPSETEVDVRVIASTNKDLRELVAAGSFREDLFFRLSVLHIALPPLRDRLEELPALCSALITRINALHNTRITSVDGAVLGALRRHDWPGNVRELRNILERAAILAREGEITPDHLPKGFGGTAPERARRDLGAVPTVTLPVGTTIEQAERELISITLLHTRHNQTKAAELLGISAKTLYNKLREYGGSAAAERSE